MPCLESRPHRSPRRAAAAASFALTLALSAAAHAQLETPAPSPKARVEQRVGVTNLSIDYSSPGVKKRKIWGGLVPFDALWRTGANMATKLTASRDFTFGGKPVPKGEYALYTIPGKTGWTVILNTNANAGGTDGYDQKNDVARVTLKPFTMGVARERMTFLFSDTTDDSVSLDLEWERLRIRIPIKVDTKAHMAAAIEEATGDAWVPHYQAARWLHDSGGDLGTALGFIDKSIAIQASWRNHWVRAQILAKQGNQAEAVAAGQQAQTLGKGDEVFENFFKADVEKAIAGWK